MILDCNIVLALLLLLQRENYFLLEFFFLHATLE